MKEIDKLSDMELDFALDEAERKIKHAQKRQRETLIAGHPVIKKLPAAKADATPLKRLEQTAERQAEKGHPVNVLSRRNGKRIIDVIASAQSGEVGAEHQKKISEYVARYHAARVKGMSESDAIAYALEPLD